MPTYILVDGEESNKAAPLTFEIPSYAERMSVPDGSWVKLGFLTTPEERAMTRTKVKTERMWVQVENRESETGPYYGILGNHPAVCKGVKIGDSIQFEAKHILGILEAD